MPIDPADYRDVVRRALDEDVRDGDITTEATVAATVQARGVFLIKAPCVLAGLDVAFETFRLLEPSVRVEARKGDGDACAAGEEIATVFGSARALCVADAGASPIMSAASPNFCGSSTRIESSSTSSVPRDVRVTRIFTGM